MLAGLATTVEWHVRWTCARLDPVHYLSLVFVPSSLCHSAHIPTTAYKQIIQVSIGPQSKERMMIDLLAQFWTACAIWPHVCGCGLNSFGSIAFGLWGGPCGDGYLGDIFQRNGVIWVELASCVLFLVRRRRLLMSTPWVFLDMLAHISSLISWRFC